MEPYNKDEIDDSLEFCKDIELFYKPKKLKNVSHHNEKSWNDTIKPETSKSNFFYPKTFHSVTEQVKEKENASRNLLKIILKSTSHILIFIIIAFFIGRMLTTYVGVYTKVLGMSMENTLYDRDGLLIDRFSYRFHEPERFDIVVFPYSKNIFYIKRIIGLPGERILIQDGTIYINGEILEEDYGKEVIESGGIAENQEVLLLEDEYFVLGDNRNHSLDSRFLEVGNIKKEDIVGRAWIRLYPFHKIGIVRNS